MNPEGRTNPVDTLEPRLDPQDEEVLCSAVCHYSNMPNLNQDGKNLEQACVTQRLGELDEILQGCNPHKPEASYDMTKNSPQLILDSQIGSSPHGQMPEWINRHWDKDPKRSPFKPGKGMIRRPDIIIVQNPNRPPIQDDIKQAVEMEFPPGPHNREQLEDYIAVADNENKTVEVKLSDCDCGQESQ